MKGVIEQLRRRNVLRSLAIYAGAAWVLIQVATQVFPFFDVPNWTIRWVVIASLVGAPLVGLLSWFYELTPAGLKRESEIDRSGEAERPRAAAVWGRGALLIVGVAAVLLIGQMGLRRWASSGESTPTAMAVMPFKNLSDNKDEVYFSDGIQDEILARLSKIAAFKVISRTSSNYYAAKNTDLKEIARQLGVTHVVEGSVQRLGDSARISVQLIAAGSDTQVWGESYDRRLTNVFDVESEVAVAIVDALQAKLTPREQVELVSIPTLNPDAYDAYLRGMAYDRRTLEADNLAEAARWLGKATELDPGFALAWARLARVNADRAYYGIALTQHPCDQARTAADTARKLKPDLGEVNLARGFVFFMCDDNLVGAEQAFSSARTRLPNDADVPRAISQVEWQRGNWTAVLQYLHDASELDPRNPELLVTYSLYLGGDRQFEEARRITDRALEITPDDATLNAAEALINQADGRFDLAQKQLDGLALRPEVIDVFDYQMLQLLYSRQFAKAETYLSAAVSEDRSALGVGIADYYFLLATAEIADGQSDAAKLTFQSGYEVLKRFDNDSIVANSSAGVYLRSMLCLTEVGQNPKALNGVDCNRVRSVSLAQGQFSLMALEVLAQADVLGGNTDAAVSAVATLLDKPYLSSRYRAPLTPALFQHDPIWTPIRDDPRLGKALGQAAPVSG